MIICNKGFYEYLDNQRIKEAICVLDNFVEDMRKDHQEEVGQVRPKITSNGKLIFHKQRHV